MASKKRNGLSKREYAAQAKVKATPKSSNRTTASKSVAPLVGAGPLLPGQVRVGGTVQGAGPLLPNQTRDNSYTGGSSQREQASKASKSKSKSSSVPGLTGDVPKGTSFGGGNSQTPDIAGGLYSGGLSAKGGAGAAPITKTGRLFQILNDPFHSGANISQSIKQRMGLGGVDLSSLAGFDDVLRSPTGIQTAEAANDPTDNANLNLLQLTGKSLGVPSSVPNNQPFNPQKDDGDTGLSGGVDPSIFDGGSTRDKSGSDGGGSNNQDGRNKNDFDPSFMGGGEGDANLSYYKNPVTLENDFKQQQNDLYGNSEQAPADLPGKTTRQTYGSGAFGTGKGVMSDDPYIKELRKAYSSNGGEKWLRKQFEELISALDPTYAQMQKEGTDALQAQLLNNNTQLASVMNANNTGDSEQRAQLMAGQQRDTSTALGNLLAKLSQNKAQDISGYKSQQAEAMSKYEQNKQQDARTLLEKLQAYKSQQSTGSTGRAKGGSSPTSTKLSRNDVFNWVEDALGKGYSWQEIADNAKEQGIGTETGGYLDQLLNNANKQKRYR